MENQFSSIAVDKKPAKGFCEEMCLLGWLDHLEIETAGTIFSVEIVQKPAGLTHFPNCKSKRGRSEKNIKLLLFALLPSLSKVKKMYLG